MSASWVAGTVRARALARRRLGAAGARDLARTDDLASARAALARTPYADGAADLAGLQHQVAATLLWHLRVLAGWLPRDGAQALRVLAGGFETANLDEHLRRSGGTARRVRRTGWARCRPPGPGSRRPPASSRCAGCWPPHPWGDPGASDPWSVHVGLRLGLGAAGGRRRARRRAVGPRRGRAAAGPRGAAVRDDAPDRLAARSAALLGAGFVEALAGPGATPADLAGRLPGDARWALAGRATTRRTCGGRRRPGGTGSSGTRSALLRRPSFSAQPGDRGGRPSWPSTPGGCGPPWRSRGPRPARPARWRSFDALA